MCCSQDEGDVLFSQQHLYWDAGCQLRHGSRVPPCTAHRTGTAVRRTQGPLRRRPAQVSSDRHKHSETRRTPRQARPYPSPIPQKEAPAAITNPLQRMSDLSSPFTRHPPHPSSARRPDAPLDVLFSRPGVLLSFLLARFVTATTVLPENVVLRGPRPHRHFKPASHLTMSLDVPRPEAEFPNASTAANGSLHLHTARSPTLKRMFATAAEPPSTGR